MRRFVSLVLLAASAALLTESAALANFSDGGLTQGVGAIECPNEFVTFRDSVVWRNSSGRVLVEATRACGSKNGDIFDLKDVVLTVFSRGKIFAVLRSEAGAYAPAQAKILLWKTRANKDAGCLEDLESVTLDLRGGSLRAPGFLASMKTGRGFEKCRKTRTQRL